jgi:hypothetical protein
MCKSQLVTSKLFYFNRNILNSNTCVTVRFAYMSCYTNVSSDCMNFFQYLKNNILYTVASASHYFRKVICDKSTLIKTYKSGILNTTVTWEAQKVYFSKKANVIKLQHTCTQSLQFVFKTIHKTIFLFSF